MKKLLLGALLLLSMTLNSQTIINGNLIINSNITIGNNCGNNPETITYTGDMNFNTNSTVTLKGVNLIINGNINGTGTITNFCNNNISDICGNLQPNSTVNITGITFCGQVLSNLEFTFTNDKYNYKYNVYDINGKLLQQGITDQNTFDNLPSKQFLIIKVDNFKSFKLYKSN